MDRVALVTGGCGFIGTWVIRELLEHVSSVVVLDSQPPPARWNRVLGSRADDIQWTDAPLADREAVQDVIERYGVTHVIHLAALLTPACQQDPFLGCQVNVLGSTAVFDAARRSGRVRAISYASSYAVYGDMPSDERPDAGSPPMFYGAFKQAVDLIAEQYWRHFGLASVAVRPHVAYGPERDLGLSAGPSLACRAAALGERYQIAYRGFAGYDFVDDVARAFVRSTLDVPSGATVVDLPSQGATPEEFVSLIEQVLPEAAGLITVDGPAIPPNIPPVPRAITRLFPDWTITPLIEGVRKTIEYYRDQRTTT